MAIVEQFQQLGYKTEVTELTAETLTAAEFDTAWDSCAIVPEGGINERRVKRATFSPIQPVGGTVLARVSGTFEPRPSGTDGTAPDWYAMLKASGATVSTDVATWGAESTATGVIGASCTFKHRDGAYERVSAGSRVSMLRFSAEKGARWLCEMEATGRYSQSAQTAYVAAAQPSAGLGQAFLGMACTIGTFSGAVASMEIAIENTVSPVEDGCHASGYGQNIITGQKLMLRASVVEDGTVEWRDLYRNDATADVVAASVVMASGTAGNVLTWTGNIALVEEPVVEYRDGIGYRTIVGEFITTGAGAALTLTQS